VKKPQLAVGQLWDMPDFQIVRVTRWGQDGGGGGTVHFVCIEHPDTEYSTSGKGFRRSARPVLAPRKARKIVFTARNFQG
jgi:hypothetical protein